MGLIKIIWNFIQNQVLGMQWLKELIGNGLTEAGLDVTSRLGGSIQFFIYDIFRRCRSQRRGRAAPKASRAQADAGRSSAT